MKPPRLKHVKPLVLELPPTPVTTAVIALARALAAASLER